MQIIPIFATAIFKGNVEEGKQDIFSQDPWFIYYLDHKYFPGSIIDWHGWLTADQWPEYQETGHGKHWFQCDP